ncbi:MAG: amino acid ABC transporter permease, partial [bacterium]|nr:amino acid ABC transporter permease [bacterium]
MKGFHFKNKSVPGFPWDMGKFILLVCLIAWLMAESAENMGYNWQWYRIPQYLGSVDDGIILPGPLIQGLAMTLKITGVSLILAFLFGLGTAILRLSNSFMGRLVSRVY